MSTDDLHFRRRETHTQKPSQGEFWQTVFAYADTLIRKLRSVGRTDLIGHIKECHTAELVITCQNCTRAKVVSNRCEKRWCPICAPRLARERVEALTWWVAQLKQPKHVVLTTRNTKKISRSQVHNFKKALRRLRSQKFARGWKSGTWAMEVTNEGKGWHLHAHVLVETRWIDAGELARKWGRLVGQDFAIVKVKDARATDYLQEVSKYVCKSAQLVTWDAQEIADFMDAFAGTRTFGVFGSLQGERDKWKQFLRSIRSLRNACECGCNRFYVEDARLWQLNKADRRSLRS